MPSSIPVFALSALGDKAHVVDVREAAEWNDGLGHIAYAEHVPLATVLDAATRWDKSATHYLVCRSGMRSARACAALEQLGFTAVNVEGGMMAWNAQGLPVARG